MNKLFLCMGILLIFTAGCMNAEQQVQADGINEKILEVQTDIETTKEKIESGEFSVADGLSALTKLNEDLTSLVAEAKDLADSGVKWWEIGLSILGGVALRGVPSKGPLVLLGNLLGNKK